MSGFGFDPNVSLSTNAARLWEAIKPPPEVVEAFEPRSEAGQVIIEGIGQPGASSSPGRALLTVLGLGALVHYGNKVGAEGLARMQQALDERFPVPAGETRSFSNSPAGVLWKQFNENVLSEKYPKAEHVIAGQAAHPQQPARLQAPSEEQPAQDMDEKIEQAKKDLEKLKEKYGNDPNGRESIESEEQYIKGLEEERFRRWPDVPVRQPDVPGVGHTEPKPLTDEDIAELLRRRNGLCDEYDRAVGELGKARYRGDKLRINEQLNDLQRQIRGIDAQVPDDRVIRIPIGH